MKALVLFALQNDFYTGGMLEHPRAKEIVNGIQQIIPKYDQVILIKKEHPHNHVIFAANHPWRKPWQTISGNWGEMTLWPFHTIEGSYGADWISDFALQPDYFLLTVGMNPAVNYRNFFEEVAFSSFITKEQIDELNFAGFCFTEGIHQTALHAETLGIKSLILTTLISSVPELEELHHHCLQH